MDLWGPYKVATYDGLKCFLTVMDDFSRMTWIFFLKLKSDVIIAIKHFLAYAKTQYDATIKTIRTNNGTEFINAQCSELFTNLGMVHQTSCSYTP